MDGAQSDLGTAGQWDIGDAYDGVAGAQISFESAGNWSGVTFTITGKDQDGNSVTVTQTGPNATTVTTSVYFSQITAITSSGTVATDIEVGAADTLITKTVPLNAYSDYQATLEVNGLSGTISFTIEETFDDVLRTATHTSAGVENQDWSTVASAQTTAQTNSATLFANAVRLKINSYTDSAEFQFTVLQNPWD